MLLFQFLLLSKDGDSGGWAGGRGCSAIPQVAYRWLCGDRLKWMRLRTPPLAPREPLATRDGGRGWWMDKIIQILTQTLATGHLPQGNHWPLELEGGAGGWIKAEEMRERRSLGDQTA